MMSTGFCKLLLVSALVLLIVSPIFAKNNNGKNHSKNKNRKRTTVTPIKTSSQCDPNYKYRLVDGTCSNLNNPLLGSSFTPYGRLNGPNSANYSDGIGAIRKSVTGGDLPSARFVSSLMPDPQYLQPANTLIAFTFGQFTDHDLAQTTGGTVSSPCCLNGQNGGVGPIGALPSSLPSECIPIVIPSTDPIYSVSAPGINCMNMIRNLPVTVDGSPQRQHVNRLTHWLDGSNIYGSTKDLGSSLRAFSNGQLAFSVDSYNRQLLPISNDPDRSCCPGAINSCPAAVRCYNAGDDRVNENPLLTTMHTIWFREHNRVAAQLVQIKPGQTDEFYYQEARRIVISELTHITYTEYVPIIVGRQFADQVLVTRNSTTSAKYKVSNPSVLTEFATAAWRMGHSLARSDIMLFEADGSLSNQSFTLAAGLEDFKGRPNSKPLFLDRDFGFLNNRFFDNMIRGLTTEHVKKIGPSFASSLHSQLFKQSGAPVGFDLIALNLQRGRDHGLPTYAQVRGYHSFKDLRATTSQQNIDLIKKMYASVYDIDLYIGGITETALPGGFLGLTFSELIAKQFLRLRLADRFFYDDLSQSVSFTPSQLAQIQNVGFARILCDINDGTITSMQPNVFTTPTGVNSPLPCSAISGIDFTKWFTS